MDPIRYGWRGGLVLGGVLFGVLSGIWSCSPDAWQAYVAQHRSFTPVILTGTELLDKPAAGTQSRIYRPGFTFTTSAPDAACATAAGFYVTLAAADATLVRMQLVDLVAGTRLELIFVEPPATEDELQLASEPRPFNEATTAHMSAGESFFWVIGAGAEPLETCFAVVLPECRLSAFTRLEMFSSVADDGTPIGTAAIELVQDFFYLAVIGDSIQWGNGLQERDKMSALVTDVIERETGRKVIRQRYAHSGARIVPRDGDSVCEVDCNGEVPTASTSIVVQAELIQRPELIDLVLMDGCINDVEVLTIINPATTNDELANVTQQYCGNEMTSLIRKVRERAPQAAIVVTGYYQVIGPDSDALALRVLEITRGLLLDEVDASILSELVEQAATFRDVAHQSIQVAIETVSTESGTTDIVFADPEFGPENAAFAPDTWLWGVTEDSPAFQSVALGLELFPEDPMFEMRLEDCFRSDAIGDGLTCVYASMGHPNPDGARAYADAVVRALRTIGILPTVPAP